jgi:defect in organelle trafficking protein DotC
MFQRRFKYLTHLLLTLSLSGCSVTHHYEVVGDTTTFEGLTKAHAIRKIGKRNTNELRLKSTYEYAFSIAAQISCAKHTRQLEQLLDQLETELDRVFNFRIWMLPNYVLPPVLVQAKKSVHLVDEKTMRIAGRTYHILKDAKFVTNPPHWRHDYLLRDAAHITSNLPKKPSPDFLPKTPEEQKEWARGVKNGWQEGILQAQANFRSNLATLQRDLNGIILYRQLRAKEMVSEPYVAQTQLGITGNTHMMRLKDQVLRITVLPTLKKNPSTWKPIVTNPETSHGH